MTDYKISIIVNGRDEASPALRSVQASLSGLSDVGKIAAGVFGGNLLYEAKNQLAGLAKEAFSAVSDYERMNYSLTSLAAREALSTGAAKNMKDALAQATPKARELQAWVQKLAINSPYSRADIESAFRMSMAYGFSADEAQRMTQAMTDFASATGLGSEGSNRIALALGQVRQVGHLTGMEMRQLTEAGVPVAEILAEQFGVTTDKIIEMREKGLIPAEKAITAIMTSFEQSYGGAAGRMTNTFSGLVSSMGDLKEVALRELSTGTFEGVRPYLAEITSTMQNPEFLAALRETGAELGRIAVSMAEVGKQSIIWFGQMDSSSRQAALGLGALVLVGPPLVNMFTGVGRVVVSFAGELAKLPGFIAEINAGFALLKAGGGTLMEALGLGGGGTVAAVLAPLAAIAATMGPLLLIVNQSEVARKKAFGASAEIVKTSSSYAEYAARVKETAAAQGLVVDASGNLYIEYQREGAIVRQLVQEHGLLTEAKWNEQQADRAMADLPDLSDRLVRQAEAVGGAAAPIKKMGEESATAAVSVEDLKKEMEAAASAARGAALANLDLASSLKFSTAVDFRQTFLQTLGERLKGANVSGDLAGSLMQTIGLALGAQTEKGLALANALGPLQEMIVQGIIPASSVTQTKLDAFFNRINQQYLAGTKNIDFKAVIDAVFGGSMVEGGAGPMAGERGAVEGEGGGFTAIPQTLENINTGMQNLASNGLPAMQTASAPAGEAIGVMANQVVTVANNMAWATEKTESWTKALMKLWQYLNSHTFEAQINLPGTLLGTTKTVTNDSGTYDTKASGGSFDGSRPLLVGERGPEIIFPSSGGWVGNNSWLKSAMQTISQMFRFYGPTNIYLADESTRVEDSLLGSAPIL